MFEVALYGREVIVRSRIWVRPFHSWMKLAGTVPGSSELIEQT